MNQGNMTPSVYEGLEWNTHDGYVNPEHDLEAIVIEREIHYDHELVTLPNDANSDYNLQAKLSQFYASKIFEEGSFNCYGWEQESVEKMMMIRNDEWAITPQPYMLRPAEALRSSNIKECMNFNRPAAVVMDTTIGIHRHEIQSLDRNVVTWPATSLSIVHRRIYSMMLLRANVVEDSAHVERAVLRAYVTAMVDYRGPEKANIDKIYSLSVQDLYKIVFFGIYRSKIRCQMDHFKEHGHEAFWKMVEVFREPTNSSRQITNRKVHDRVFDNLGFPTKVFACLICLHYVPSTSVGGWPVESISNCPKCKNRHCLIWVTRRVERVLSHPKAARVMWATQDDESLNPAYTCYEQRPNFVKKMEQTLPKGKEELANDVASVMFGTITSYSPFIRRRGNMVDFFKLWELTRSFILRRSTIWRQLLIKIEESNILNYIPDPIDASLVRSVHGLMRNIAYVMGGWPIMPIASNEEIIRLLSGDYFNRDDIYRMEPCSFDINITNWGQTFFRLDQLTARPTAWEAAELGWSMFSRLYPDMTHLNRFDFYGREDPPATIMLGPRRRDGGALKFPDLWEPIQGTQGLVYHPEIDEAGIGDIYNRWLITRRRDFTDCTLRHHTHDDVNYEPFPRPGIRDEPPTSYWTNGQLVGEDTTTKDVAYTIYTEQGVVTGFGKRPEFMYVASDNESIRSGGEQSDEGDNLINEDGGIGLNEHEEPVFRCIDFPAGINKNQFSDFGLPGRSIRKDIGVIDAIKQFDTVMGWPHNALPIVRRYGQKVNHYASADGTITRTKKFLGIDDPLPRPSIVHIIDAHDEVHSFHLGENTNRVAMGEADAVESIQRRYEYGSDSDSLFDDYDDVQKGVQSEDDDEDVKKPRAKHPKRSDDKVDDVTRRDDDDDDGDDDPDDGPNVWRSLWSPRWIRNLPVYRDRREENFAGSEGVLGE